jgi:Major Facilitator Superfamily
LEDHPVSDPDHDADRPATFREVLASGEFRAVYASYSLSTFGDAMARAAVTALVYQRTGSALLAASTFAISYLPWIGLGSLLAAVAERYPYRRTMVICDLVRMVTIGLVAVPGMPVPALLGLLFLTALFDPPFKAARSALAPMILSGDRFVVGLSLMETAAQLALIVGYLAGGTVAGYNPRLAVLFDAATFGISALIVRIWVHHYEPALRRERRTDLLHETAEGFRVVFGRPVLRAIAVVIFTSLLFAVVPEGLGAAWAGLLAKGHHQQGWTQGVIMCAMPTGFILGSLLITRFVNPTVRQRLIRPFAIVAPLALVAALLRPNVYGVAALAATSGFAVAALLPAANGLFVQALPNEVRARAFGVMQSGVQLSQGLAVFVTGALATRYSLPAVVGYWGVGGALLMLVASLTWPRREAVTAEINLAKLVNRDSTPDRTSRVDTSLMDTRDLGAAGPPASPRLRSRGRHAVDPADDNTEPLRIPAKNDDDPPGSGGGRHRLRAASY